MIVPVRTRASRSSAAAGAGRLSRTSNQSCRVDSHWTADSTRCCGVSAAASGCTAIARSASPAWTAPGVSAAIHQTRAYRSAFTSANRAASVLLPTPPNPCTAAIATRPELASAAVNRASSADRPTNSPDGVGSCLIEADAGCPAVVRLP